MNSMLDQIAEEHDDDFSRVKAIVDVLDKRKRAKKVAVRDSLKSPIFTEPEATVRVLVGFFSVASNAGTLYEELGWGLSLKSKLEEIGANGCVAALDRLEVIDDEYRRVEERMAKGEDCDAEYDALWGRRREAEAGAEGDFVWATLLWNYAKKHRDSILVSA